MFDINDYLKEILTHHNRLDCENKPDTRDLRSEMLLIDERYKAENLLLDAITEGNEEDAINALMEYGRLMQSPQQKPSPTSEDSLRDFKNSIHTMNTLFRKAIENNKVHPIHIHEYSSKFGDQIERATDFDDLVEIVVAMIKRYCHLSRQYSLASYSKTIHDAVLFIELNLCSSISTKTIATSLFLSPNYLSTQFNHEIGKNITDYIRERRIKIAKRLLLSTQMNVQEIATAVGIDDVSYFSKQFKQETGCSPMLYRKKYRQSNINPSS